jgi:hypothetical protein
MKYTIEVSVTYTQVVEVEADTQERAEFNAFYEFDLEKAYRRDSEFFVLKTEEETK